MNLMKEFIQPYPEIPGDNEDRIMARSWVLHGFSKSRAVYRFGFIEDSDLAKAFNCHVPEFGFVWIIATHSGRELHRWTGIAVDLPKRYRKILDNIVCLLDYNHKKEVSK